MLPAGTPASKQPRFRDRGPDRVTKYTGKCYENMKRASCAARDIALNMFEGWDAGRDPYAIRVLNLA